MGRFGRQFHHSDRHGRDVFARRNQRGGNGGPDHRFYGDELALGTDGSTTDSQIDLTGSFTLPTLLGGFQIPVAAAAPFVVGAAGLSLQMGPYNIPVNVTFDLDDIIQVAAKNMSFTYVAATEELKVQGDFSAGFKVGEQEINLNLDLAGENYIDYEAGRDPLILFDGSFSYSNSSPPTFFNSWFPSPRHK